MSELIVSILEDFLDKPRKHNPEKGQIAFDCPACSAEKGMPQGDGKGNLEVNYFKGVFKCWACWQYNDMSGSIPKLIKKYGNKKHLHDYYLLKPEQKDIVENKEPNIVKLPEGFTPLLISRKFDSDYQEAMAYLKSRNIGMDIIAKFNIGYTSVGKYAGRIIIPSYDINGELNYFTGRAFKKHIWPRYKNPDTDKSLIIFNEEKINWDATIYLVEGPFDHIVVPNSIPLLGKYISNKIFMALLNNASSDVIIVLDDDAKRDIQYLNKLLNINQLYGRVKVVYLPAGYDIAKIHEKLGSRGVLKALRKAERIKESSDYTKVKLKGS